ncbi:hypothetical protein [Actinomadura atramentaria]|uniref:hypothetical protein n=1 Tax=Actinomadura atramentaria TaxID=1990 RepID=UPI000361A802|nr:hypothetical protein [Actinomadura atramentaria]
MQAQSAYAYATVRDSGRALAAAGDVRLGELRGIARGRHLLDVARAHLDERQPRAAEQRLADARSVLASWFVA